MEALSPNCFNGEGDGNAVKMLFCDDKNLL